MSLKDEAKAADASLRKAIKDVEHLGWLTVISKYNGELRSNLQMAKQDVERLTLEAKSCKERAIAAEAKVEGLETTIASLKQQVAGLSQPRPRPDDETPRVEFVGPGLSLHDAPIRQIRALMIWPGICGLGAHPRIKADAVWVDEMCKHAKEFGVKAAITDLLTVLRQSGHYLMGEADDEALRVAAAATNVGRKLPSPRVTPEAQQANSGGKWTANMVLAVMLNPIHVGLPGFGVTVSEAKWLRVVLREIQQSSLEQVLVDILYLLKRTYTEPGVDEDADSYDATDMRGLFDADDED